VDLKNAAFVKMRDSVSFCKQILIEYVLKNPKWEPDLYIRAGVGPCAGMGTSHDSGNCGGFDLVGNSIAVNSRRLVAQVNVHFRL
jgi:hypothetical protein